MQYADKTLKSFCTVRNIIICACVLVISGCAVFVPAPRNNLLLAPTPVNVFGKDVTRLSVQVGVSLPESAMVFENERIVIVRGPEYTYLPDFQWVVPTPRLVQNSFIEWLENLNAFTGIAAESSGLYSDMRISMDIRKFNFVVDKNAKHAWVEIVLSIRLIDQQTGYIIAQSIQSAKKEVMEDNPEHVYETFEDVFGQVLSSSVSWVYTETAKWSNRTKR